MFNIRQSKSFFSLLSSNRWNSTKAKLFLTNSTNIKKNLALENFIVETLKPSYPVLFLWKNDKTVIIGKNQNAWRECDTAKIDRDGVTLCRRFTGGGAVYQDLGNSCFTFVQPNASADKISNNKLILDVLKDTFGINGAVSGRNDLCVDDKKFSGQSFKHVNNLVLHNGTIMFSVDKDGLAKYLTPDKSKLAAKGITSVASRVVNLSTLNPDCNHNNFMLALFQKFATQNGITAPENLNEVELLEDFVQTKPEYMASVETFFNKLNDWDHTFGSTPPFSFHLGVERFEGLGTFEFSFNVKDGRIINTGIFSDCLDVNFVEHLRETLGKDQNLKYSRSAIRTALEEMGKEIKKEEESARIADWVVSKMEE